LPNELKSDILRSRMKVPFSLVLTYLLIFLRLTTPALVFYDPFWASVLALTLDSIDGNAFCRAGFTSSQYQRIDKFLDFYWYAFALIFLLTHPPTTLLFALFVSFFLLRLLGEILFYVKDDRRIFLFFPNLFEPLFYVYVLSQKFNWPSLLQPIQLAVVLLIIIPVKILLEYLLHIRLISFGNLLFGEGFLAWKD
jgi:hypothetical protein